MRTATITMDSLLGEIEVNYGRESDRKEWQGRLVNDMEYLLPPSYVRPPPHTVHNFEDDYSRSMRTKLGTAPPSLRIAKTGSGPFAGVGIRTERAVDDDGYELDVPRGERREQHDLAAAGDCARLRRAMAIVSNDLDGEDVAAAVEAAAEAAAALAPEEEPLDDEALALVRKSKDKELRDEAVAELMSAVDEDGCTALFLAALNGKTEAVRLLSKHSDLGAQDKRGMTALHVAATWGRKAIVDHLLAEGGHSDLSREDFYGRTAEHLAYLNGEDEIARSVRARVEELA